MYDVHFNLFWDLVTASVACWIANSSAGDYWTGAAAATGSDWATGMETEIGMSEDEETEELMRVLACVGTGIYTVLFMMTKFINELI